MRAPPFTHSHQTLVSTNFIVYRDCDVLHRFTVTSGVAPDQPKAIRVTSGRCGPGQLRTPRGSLSWSAPGLVELRQLGDGA